MWCKRTNVYVCIHICYIYRYIHEQNIYTYTYVFIYIFVLRGYIIQVVDFKQRKWFMYIMWKIIDSVFFKSHIKVLHTGWGVCVVHKTLTNIVLIICLFNIHPTILIFKQRNVLKCFTTQSKQIRNALWVPLLNHLWKKFYYTLTYVIYQKQ